MLVNDIKGTVINYVITSIMQYEYLYKLKHMHDYY